MLVQMGHWAIAKVNCRLCQEHHPNTTTRQTVMTQRISCLLGELFRVWIPSAVALCRLEQL